MTGPFVLNRDLVLDRLGGDEEILAMMIDLFLQDVDNNCTMLATALASGDPAALQREAHTIKGLLATISDDGGAAVALGIELQSKGGNLAGLDEAVQTLQARLQAVAEVLRRESGN